MTKQRMVEVQRTTQRKTIIPIIVAGNVVHLLRCHLKYFPERFVSRLHRLGMDAAVAGKWVTNDQGCHFEVTA